MLQRKCSNTPDKSEKYVMVVQKFGNYCDITEKYYL